MKVWGFILAIFIYSLLASTMNEMGLMQVHEVADFNESAMTDQSASIKEVVTEDSESSVLEKAREGFGLDLIFIAIKMFDVLFKALAMTLWVQAPLVNFGVPAALANMIQAIVTFMEMIFIFQVWRRFKMEN
ncbi:MAG: hypothetical protein KAQ85_00180 [Thermodesulfovibrionia bacterium]|nr:hypothetical protein [Thermodesulfovibrionia bacterium]